jgi:hypothetical protein
VSLQDTFAWLRDTTPLRLQELPGQPGTAMAFPDASDAQLAASVAAALAPGANLAETAAGLSAACALSGGGFAASVPVVVAALRALHADTPLLTALSAELFASHWDAETGPRHVPPPVPPPAQPGAQADGGEASGPGPARRRAQAAAGAYFFDSPPVSFTVRPPAALPALALPLVFHVLQYVEANGSVSPAK